MNNRLTWPYSEIPKEKVDSLAFALGDLNVLCRLPQKENPMENRCESINFLSMTHSVRCTLPKGHDHPHHGVDDSTWFGDSSALVEKAAPSSPSEEMRGSLPTDQPNASH